MTSTTLPWPPEPADDCAPTTRLDVPPSNCLLDLHGSPQAPELVLFMAGNQFRALPDLVAAFRAAFGVQRIFYATTPPGLLIDAMAGGRLASGNFVLELGRGRLWPDVFMAGPREHQRLARAGWIGTPRPYASNRGCALLVRRGNPLRVHTVADLLRDEVRVALSSPDREPASHASYAATLQAQGGPDTVARILAKPGTWMPQRVHHREAPQALADGLADVAPLYSHLASYLSEQMPGLFETVGLPSEGNHCDELSVAPLIGAANAANGAAWSDFLCSAPAAAILQRHGFDPARG